VPVPLDEAQAGAFWGTVGYRVVGRLNPGVTTEAASAEVRQVVPPFRLENPLWTPGEDYGRNASVAPLQSELSANVERTLLILLAAVGAVLLIACANIANLLLARATARGREVAIRTALGATRSRIIRQLLTESIVLSLTGGLLGLALAAVGVRVLAWRLPPDTPRIAHVSIDPRVIGFTALVAIMAGVLFGLAPALRTVATDLRGVLTDGQRGTTSRSTTRLSGLFVAGEMALAVVLVISAGLLLRSFWRLSQVDPGVRIAEVVTARISPPATNFGAERRTLLFESVLERARALPGVTTAALIGEPPFIGGPDLMATRVAEHPDYGALNGGPLPMAHRHVVTPDYLSGLGIPLRRGRMLTDADRQGTPRVALVNETFAREMWPDEDPIGKRIGYPWPSEWLTVVGVVADVRHAGLDSGEEMEFYEPLAQIPGNSAASGTGAMTLVLRMAGSQGAFAAGPVAEQVRSTVASIDPAVAVSDVRRMRDLLAMSVDAPRTTMFLLLAFAVVALALGAVGIYGTIAYWVGQRLHEMGLRLALGAKRGDILRLVVAQGMTFAIGGLAVGLIAAFAATRVLAGLLFGVSPTDAVTFIAVPVFLALVAAAASAIPALRAARVDPMRAMGRG
jgi:putative ABC transport system permease protein